MVERNDDPTGNENSNNPKRNFLLTRRHWLTLAGGGLAGGALASTGARADKTDHPNTIIFDGTVSAGKSKYSFSVSGSVEPMGDVGALEVKDTINGSSVTGAVHRDRDAYRFSGNLTALDIVGDSAVSIEYGDSSDIEADRLTIVASESAAVEYQFSATDRIEPVRDTNDNPANDDDTVQENDDGSWTATGNTGEGAGDTFDFWGEIVSFEPYTDDLSLFLNGEPISPSELTGKQKTRRLEIVASDHVEYAFTASDEIQKVLENGSYSSEDNDTVTENSDGTWTVEGLTGGGEGDTFDFLGDALEFDILVGDCTLYLDGTEVSIEELTGESQPEHRLEIVAADHVEYVFSTTGEMTKILDNGAYSSEDNDTVTENSDGTWTVEGLTGGGEGDTFDFLGEATQFDILVGDCVLYLDGVEVTPEELVGEETRTHSLEIVRSENDYLEYTFTTTGEITRDLDNGDRSAESDNDSVFQNDDGTWTVEGVTGDGFGDTFDFIGEVLAFEPKEGQFALYLDGTQVTAYELTGEEPPATSSPVDGGPIGGGGGYPNTVARDEADVVVSSKSGLEDALSSASSGDVVYVAGNASIDMGTTEFTVPEGVTLASNRGIDDAPGGHLYTDEESRSLHLDRDVRLTGLRIQGPFYDFFSTSEYVGGVGVRATEPGIEIDNCELWGFAYAAIGGPRNDEHIHHNNIHHNPRDSVGYGIDCIDGQPLIEWNYFNHNRHSIAASGDGGYIARYNHFGPETIDAPIDCHSPGGTRIEVYRNTVEAVIDSVDGERRWPAVSIRGVPDDVCTVYDNWFYNPAEPRNSPDGWTDEAIIQVHVDEWTNMQWSNNHYGESEPSTDIGHPR